MSAASSLWDTTLKPRDNDTTPEKLESGNAASSPAASLSTGSISALSSIRRHFDAELTPKYADYIVLCFWFMTGFLDSTIFQAYRTFVSMQTGNTIFIALSAAATTITPAEDNIPIPVRPYGWLKSLVSLMTFLMGSIFFSRLGRMIGVSPKKRWTFTISFALQTSMILLSAILAQTSVVESRLEYIGEDMDWMHLVPIALLSFQAPGQVAAGRVMGMPEVSTVVVTTMVYDFGSDERLFVGILKNAVRNRRFVGWFTMLVGAIVGGFLTVRTRHIAETLWIGSAIKACITVAWMVWPAKKEEPSQTEA